MSKSQFLILLILVAIATTGCRNRCNPAYNNWYGTSPTIAPPPTYSLNIPSVARNPNPYYNRLDTNGQAPTPAQPGWRPSDANGATSTPNNNPGSVPGNNRPTTFVERGSTGIAQPGFRTASAAPLPGSGISSTNSTNYNTTSFDERQDSTRLPVTDASTVRAPSRNFPTGNASGVYPAGYAVPISPQQTYVAQNNLLRSGQVAYPGYGVLVPGQPVLPAPPTYSGQAYFSNQPVVSQSSTVTAGAQPGWRDRDRNSGRDRF